MIKWGDIVFAFNTWRMKRLIKRHDRHGTGPLCDRAWRKQRRGETLTPEEQEALDAANEFLAKIRTPDRKEGSP
jgi:hypothetical protein